MDDQLFPIQGDWVRGKDGRMINIPPSKIPMWLAEEAFKEYHRRWSSQSLEELAQRGGFGREELLMLLRREKECQKIDIT